MLRRVLYCLVITPILGAAAKATLLTGPLINVEENATNVYWGDGLHNLTQQWSIALFGQSGWFYGSAYGWSNADVFNAGPWLANSDLSTFAYTDRPVKGAVGDLILFRGVNGYYGAWRIDAINPAGNHGNIPYFLNGQWYFQTDHTADFSLLPEPRASLACLIAVSMNCVRRRDPRRN